jgi:hypothetical protein
VLWKVGPARLQRGSGERAGRYCSGGAGEHQDPSAARQLSEGEERTDDVPGVGQRRGLDPAPKRSVAAGRHHRPQAEGDVAGAQRAPQDSASRPVPGRSDPRAGRRSGCDEGHDPEGHSQPGDEEGDAARLLFREDIGHSRLFYPESPPAQLQG